MNSMTCDPERPRRCPEGDILTIGCKGAQKKSNLPTLVDRKIAPVASCHQQKQRTRPFFPCSIVMHPQTVISPDG